MNVIVSTSFEASTDRVLDWLGWYKADFLRINVDKNPNPKAPIYVQLDNKNPIQSNFLPTESDIESIWFRRPGSLPQFDALNGEAFIDQKEFEPILRRFNEELMMSLLMLKDYLVDIEDVDRVLGNYWITGMNKLKTLEKAKNNGLTIPKTLVTTQKKDLIAFLESCSNGVITKALHETLFANQVESEQIYTTYTEVITDEIVALLPEQFYPSLFQEKLEKKYELRIVYLDGECYSMAMFSQFDEQTSVDFRRYNKKKGSRNVPYQLPKETEENIKNLMKELRLNMGSIDIIKTKDNKLVFLEVNPVGQYGMTSYPCNYHLNKKIAEYLINEDSNHS